MEADLARVLVIGGTGYLGGLIAATLLTRTQDVVVLATRPGHERDDIVARLRMEITAAGDREGDSLERLRIVPLPAPGDARGFSGLFREQRIEEVVNCAGAVHYHDVAALKQSNVDLVNDLLAASKEARIARFIHISTAFAHGFTSEAAPETLLAEPAGDPTEYTRFKRRAEWIVAESGLPFLILRPSIVIGDSRDGHYFGPPYGLYQYWQSFAKVLMSRYRETIHVVASSHKLPLLHQDAFIATLMAARETLKEDAFVNVVSSPDLLPTVEELWRLFSDLVVHPRELRVYGSLEEAPLASLDPRYQVFLAHTAVNTEIARHPWRFETGHRDRLMAHGLVFPQVTIDSVRKCQSRFAGSSESVRRYHQKFEALFPGAPKEPRALADRLETAGGGWLL
ncbi:MAG: hypothetical protein CTY15_05795 [Methylocystis sp.]|nr:MAG: hypothetical protein CTY15_05795 [Methylocystis sp.]